MRAALVAVAVVVVVAFALLVAKTGNREAAPAAQSTGFPESQVPVDADPASPVEPVDAAERRPSRDPGLSDGVRIRGRVVDGRGLPVGRFSLRVFLWIDDVPYHEVVASQRFDSAADGRFELDELPAGLLSIEARVDGLPPAFSGPVYAGARSTESDVLVRVAVGGTLRGRVLDARTRTPVAGAHVAATAVRERMPWEDAEPAHTSTDAAGGFVLEHLAWERYLVRVAADGYSDVFLRDVIVAEGEEAELAPTALRAEAFLSLSGVVTGPSGEWLANAIVQLVPDELDEAGNSQTVRCDARGGYRFERVAAGDYEVSACRSEGRLSDDPVVVLAEINHSQRALHAEGGASCVLDLRLPADARR